MRVASHIVVWSLLIAALACGPACDAEPRIILGKLPVAGRDAGVPAAGSGGHEDEDEDEDEHDEDECSEDEPVCGTDGETYRNSCQALAAGVSVSKRGAC